MKDAQTLSLANGPAIKRLVIFHVEFERQARALPNPASSATTMKIKVPQMHPSWGVMKQAAEACRKMEAELGISPRRRSNVGKIQKKTRRSTAADEFLKPVAARPGNAWAKKAVDGSEGSSLASSSAMRPSATCAIWSTAVPRAALGPDRHCASLRFFPALFSITAGAKAGAKFELLPWQMFCAGSLFGWKTSGRLRFRNAWLETGKGQAKSPLMGAIGLYMMGWHGIPRSEVYSIGWDKRTANVLFKRCRLDVPGADSGSGHGRHAGVARPGDHPWLPRQRVEDRASRDESHFQALANTDSISGPRPSLVAADEIHEFKSDDPLKTWRQAITKQAGDAMLLMGTNTPASSTTGRHRILGSIPEDRQGRDFRRRGVLVHRPRRPCGP
jgi:hypothetical protein